jgi:hypothetical protein
VRVFFTTETQRHEEAPSLFQIVDLMAAMSANATGLRAHAYRLAHRRQVTIELLCFPRMRSTLFLVLSGVRIDRSNFLKLGMEIYSYNNHRWLLSPELVGWL